MRQDQHDTSLMRYESAQQPQTALARSWDGGFGSPFGNEQQAESLWTVIDDRMRGRWRWMIVVGLALSFVLGLVGFISTEPTYKSVGAVRVTPRVRYVLQETPEHQIPFYDRYVATQTQSMKQRRVLDLALTQLKRRQDTVGEWANEPGSLHDMQEWLEVDADRSSEFIYVAFESDNPQLSEAVVNSVLEAYDDLYGRMGGSNIDRTKSDVRTIEIGLKHERAEILAKRKEITSKYGTDDLRALQATNLERLTKLENDITTGNRALERLNNQIALAEENPDQVAEPTQQILEAMMPELVTLRQHRDEARMAFEMIKARYHPGSTQFEYHQRRAETTGTLYENQYNRALEMWKVSGADPLITRDSVYEGMTMETIRLELANLVAEAAQFRKKQELLGADLVAMDELLYEENRLKDELDRARDRLRGFETESNQLSGIISVAQPGFVPERPHRDGRRKRAILGAGIGMFASFALFFVIGTIDRRAMGASQLHGIGAAAGIPSCLGVLPDLGDSLRDPETSDVAAHCVHQIRNQIEARREPTPGYVLSVSSPFQGDGKTSIIMALGWSYATAGYKTLLVDCDLVGRSLTRQLGLVGREGLKEALIEGGVNGSVTQLPVNHLSALPVGVDIRFGSENVRRIDLTKLLDSLRDQYDMILVDTGPLLGALESTPVSAASDGVVLSVRRGRSRSRLEECVARLNMVGTKCVGVILNCAVRADCYRYVSEASLAANTAERLGKSRDDGSRAAAATSGEGNTLVLAMKHASRGSRSTE